MFFGRKKNQNSHAPKPPGAEPSFLGRNTYVEGHINCDGELHIDGQLRGQVRAALCVIDRNGTVFGNVYGEVVHVRGRVTGPIQGGAVYIYAGAHIEGDVFNDTISVEPGAFVDGAIRRNQNRATIAPPQQQQQQQAEPAQRTGTKGLRVVSSE